MRMAFLLSGQPTTFEFCFPSLKQWIIDAYHPDIFICSNEQKEKLTDLYHPVAIEVRPEEYILEAAKKLRENFDYPGEDVIKDRDFSTGWKVLRCSQMKREQEAIVGFKYDVVALGRFDVKYLYVQPIEPVPNNVFCIPKVDARMEAPASNGLTYYGYSAQLSWCASETADKLYGTTIFGDWDYVKYYGYKINDEPERLLKYACDVNGIRPQYVDIKMMIIKGQSFAPLAFDLGPLERYPEYL